VVLLSLAIVIAVHHFGHRLAAKAFGLDVEPSILGCCAPRAPATFGSVALGKRLLLALAGPATSYLLAVVPLTIVSLQERKVASLTIDEVAPTFPAAEAGVQPGDTIERLDGAAVRTFAELREHLAQKPESLRLTLRRGAESVEVELGPRPGPDGNAVIGVVPRQVAHRPSFGDAFANAHRAPLRVLAVLVLGTVEAQPLAGPVAIVQSVSETSWGTALFAAFTNLALYAWVFGALHLLPLPGLDGWLLLTGVRELITRKKPDYAWHQQARGKALLVFGVAVLLLIALVLKNDFSRALR
jgi:regulator of sigma E protease